MRWLEEAGEHAGRPGSPIPGIREYFARANHPELLDDDLACNAAVACLCLLRGGIKPPRALAGSSFLSFGTPIGEPRKGAVVVMPVPEDARAHRVGFVYAVSGNQITALVGCASGVVQLRLVDRAEVTAYRWPVSARAGGPTAPLAAELPPPLAAPQVPAPQQTADHPGAATEYPDVGSEQMPRFVRTWSEAVATVPPPAESSPAEPPPAEPPAQVPDEERRAVAKQRLQDALREVSLALTAQQPRYELAMLARNGNARALQLFQEEAVTRGVKVATLADEVIAERLEGERQLMQAYATALRIQIAIGGASGGEIEKLAENGIGQIGVGG